MQLQIKTLNERIKRETKTYNDKLTFQNSCQEVIDFINNLPLEHNYKNMEPLCEVSTFVWNVMKIHIDGIPLEDAIEYILGSVHRQFNIWWELKIKGLASDPVFIFSIVGDWTSWIEIHIKEGKFKQCKVIKEIDFVKEAIAAEIKFKLQMVCE